MGCEASKPAIEPSALPQRWAPSPLPPPLIPVERVRTKSAPRPPSRAPSQAQSLHQSEVRQRSQSQPQSIADPAVQRRKSARGLTEDLDRKIVANPSLNPRSRRDSQPDTSRRRHHSQGGEPSLPGEAFSSVGLAMDYTGRIGNIEVVASGGFSDVRKGVISATGLAVTIKSLPSTGLAANEKDTEAEAQHRVKKGLAREMRLWVDLKHPRILALVGFAFVDDRPCRLSPWCKNGNVMEYLSRNPSADRQNLVRQVAEGLVYLHSLFPPVVHGDVKSRNVMITDSGDAVLCYSGLGRRLSDGTLRMTTSTETFMSLRYAAAEILRDEKPTMKTDVYSFACVALEILTDKCPFFAVTHPGAVINLILKGASLAPSDYPELPAGYPLWHLFGRCWAGDPKKRPTMEEALQELDTGLRDGARASNNSIPLVRDKPKTEESNTLSRFPGIPSSQDTSMGAAASIGHQAAFDIVDHPVPGTADDPGPFHREGIPLEVGLVDPQISQVQPLQSNRHEAPRITASPTDDSASELGTNKRALDSIMTALAHKRIDPERLTMILNVDLVVAGGFGEVRGATLDANTPSASHVAVKELRPAGSSKDRIRLAVRLARELRVWANLAHVNILPLIGFYLNEDMTVAQLISPFAPHGHIADYLERTQPGEAERIRLATDTMEGLEYLHSFSPPVCHGDLKAHNILVSTDRRAMVCDFGLATVLDENPSGLTTSKGFVGSTRYLSPELLMVQESYRRTLHSDIWAWGCLLLEILCDMIPYSYVKADTHVIIEVYQGSLPASLDNLPISDHLKSLLKRCWTKKAESRPTARQCLDILVAAIANS